MNEAAVLARAAELCKRFEGLSLKPYRCPAGVPTIGYGSTRYADGKRVTMSDPPISTKDADDLLLTTLRQEYLPGVLKASPNLAQHPEVCAAIVDFAYNLGVGQYRYSTLRQRVLDENWPAVITELNKWVFSGGKKLPGLITRRRVEAELVAAATTITKP